MNLKSLNGNKSRRVSDGENDYEDYKQKLAAFLPTINAKDVDSYYDDLYLRVTPESTAFIKSLPQPTYKVGGWRVSIFVDNIEKDRWYEIKIGNPYGDLRGRDSRTDFSQICKGGSISDSRRVKDSRRVSDSEGNYKKYMATVQVDLDKDEQGGYEDTFISETTGKIYTSDDFMNGVLVKEGDFCDTYEDAYNQAVDLCFEFVNNGFKNDGYVVSIEEFIMDETTGEIIESEEYNRYNAWYSRGEIIMA